ncbi:hypothetical protein [Haladaptatus sp. DFWS20]|uniref:hypothetical protein n=1 Tax=Haladaptatus sp. DFWS20 TaxID=3403467 RepID=UPI003EC077A6
MLESSRFLSISGLSRAGGKACRSAGGVAVQWDTHDTIRRTPAPTTYTGTPKTSATASPVRRVVPSDDEGETRLNKPSGTEKPECGGCGEREANEETIVPVGGYEGRNDDKGGEDSNVESENERDRNHLRRRMCEKG